MGLAYWYVTAVALAVAGFILAWIWLFRLGPTDESGLAWMPTLGLSKEPIKPRRSS